MIDKEFVPYEESLALEKLGFDEWCFSFYHNGQLYNSEGYYKKGDNVFPKTEVVAPTFSQAFRWFREEYGVYADIYRNGVKFVACIEDMILGSSRETVIDEGVEYEEAELACLRKLIEIVKNK